jgi:ABC-2 type transport system permease protein
MQVFKTYFKVIKSNMLQISIYVFVFLALAIIFTQISSTTETGDFTQAKTRTVLINEDENSVLVTGLEKYLGGYSEYISIENSTEKLQDALFFKEAEYIVRIPKGFTNEIMSGKNCKINKTVIPGTANVVYTDMLINQYLNTAKVYLAADKDITQAELVTKVANDLKNEAKVELRKSQANNTHVDSYFNFLAYVLISVIVLGVTSIMMVFNNKNLRRRNLCSPIKNTSINLQIILGNIVFSVGYWALMIICGFALIRGEMLTMSGLFYCINSFVLTIVVLCMSFLAGIFIKGRNAQSGVSNVLSLGLSFISGVFVPQWVLSKSVLAIAKFTPTYWYVKANSDISKLTNFSIENLTPIFQNMLIEIGFAVALLSVGLVMSKRKQMGGN